MMGHSLAAACAGDCMWASLGRSAATRDRAESAGLTDAGSVHDLCAQVDVMVSICPPSAAIDVAQVVAGAGFDGIYVDANAVAPSTAETIGALFDHFVDGSVIGPPALTAGTTRLYLAGDRAAEVAALWEQSTVDARVIEGGEGAASALKMAYASWTKIGAALQLSIRAFASQSGVDDALLDEWALSQGELGERSERAAAAVAPKAWRFVGEMDQIAQSFAEAGMADGFARAAAGVYAELEGFKDAAPGAAEVISSLTSGDD